jgi:hypothetical protein
MHPAVRLQIIQRTEMRRADYLKKALAMGLHRFATRAADWRRHARIVCY